jgi:hypothetical protein
MIRDVTANSAVGLWPVREDRRQRRRRPPDSGAEHCRKSRKFFDEMNDWARGEGHAGLGYVTRKGGVFGGPIAKNHGEERMEALFDALGLGPMTAASSPPARKSRRQSWPARRAPAWASSWT